MSKAQEVNQAPPPGKRISTCVAAKCGFSEKQEGITLIQLTWQIDQGQNGEGVQCDDYLITDGAGKGAGMAKKKLRDLLQNAPFARALDSDEEVADQAIVDYIFGKKIVVDYGNEPKMTRSREGGPYDKPMTDKDKNGNIVALMKLNVQGYATHQLSPAMSPSTPGPQYQTTPPPAAPPAQQWAPPPPQQQFAPAPQPGPALPQYAPAVQPQPPAQPQFAPPAPQYAPAPVQQQYAPPAPVQQPQAPVYAAPPAQPQYAPAPVQQPQYAAPAQQPQYAAPAQPQPQQQPMQPQYAAPQQQALPMQPAYAPAAPQGAPLAQGFTQATPPWSDQPAQPTNGEQPKRRKLKTEGGAEG